MVSCFRDDKPCSHFERKKGWASTLLYHMFKGSIFAMLDSPAFSNSCRQTSVTSGTRWTLWVAFVKSWVTFSSLSYVAWQYKNRECKNNRTSKDVVVDIALRGVYIRWLYFSSPSRTYLPLNLFVEMTLSRKTGRKNFTVRPFLFPYRWNPN